MWDVESGACLERMAGHEGTIWSMQFDGRRVASCDDEGAVRLWDMGSHRRAFVGGRPLYRLLPRLLENRSLRLAAACPNPPSPPHNCLRRVGVSAAQGPFSLKCIGMDGAQVAAAGESGALALWSLDEIQRTMEVRRVVAQGCHGLLAAWGRWGAPLLFLVHWCHRFHCPATAGC